MANSGPQWFAAVYTGLVAATYCCLLINAFVGFQFAEDGTPLSLWVCQISANPRMCATSYRSIGSPALFALSILCRLLLRHRDIQRLRWLRLLKARRSLDHLLYLASHLCRHIRRLPARPCGPYTRRQVADW